MGKDENVDRKHVHIFLVLSEAQYNYTCSLSENMQLCVTWQGNPYLIPLSRGNVYFRIPFARFYSTAPNENRL